jgi:hypothetical protein
MNLIKTGKSYAHMKNVYEMCYGGFNMKCTMYCKEQTHMISNLHDYVGYKKQTEIHQVIKLHN